MEFNPIEYEEPEKQVFQDDTGSIELKAFYDSIIKVEKIKSPTLETGASWIITTRAVDVKGVEKTEKICIKNSQLMKGPHAFEELFKSRFGYFLPYKLKKKESGKKNKWIIFLQNLELESEEIEPEESEEWIQAGILLDAIAGLQILEDGIKWADDLYGLNCLYRLKWEGDIYYLLRSKKIHALIRELYLTKNGKSLSEAMGNMRVKRMYNPSWRIGGKLFSNLWWFTEKGLMEHGLGENHRIPFHVMEGHQ